MTFDIYGDRAVEAMALIREFARVEYWDYFKGDPERALEAFCVMQDAAEAKSAARIAELTAEVREWLCDKCAIVYPGPPQEGFNCVVCPKCSGNTGPRKTVLLRKAEARIADLEAQVSALKAAGGVPTIDRARLFAIANSLIAEVDQGEEDDDDKSYTIRGIAWMHSEVLKVLAAPQAAEQTKQQED
jgi:chorismate mutase